jgi:hypothetical protein
MIDPSIAAKIAGYQQELRNEREENRKRFPQAAQFKDAAERVFGKCKLIRATNAAGESVGPVDSEPWIAWPDFGIYGGSSAQGLRDKAVK